MILLSEQHSEPIRVRGSQCDRADMYCTIRAHVEAVDILFSDRERGELAGRTEDEPKGADLPTAPETAQALLLVHTAEGLCH